MRNSNATATAIEAAQAAVDAIWDARRAYRDNGDIEAFIAVVCEMVGHLEAAHETIANPILGPTALAVLP